MRSKVCMFLLAACMLFIQSCDVSRQVSAAYYMAQCKYDYHSISRLSLAGIDLSNGVGLTTGPRVIAALAGHPSSVPLSFTVNLDVTNPQQSTAALQGLAYILKIDGIEFTTGSITQALQIPSGATRVLPVTIGLDLATLLTGDAGNAVQNIVKNFVGVGNEKSKVSLQIKPSFRIGRKTVSAPQYIPVNFTFGGK
ncbi:MAG: hypothetical protein LUG51_16895 [Tannerellaceae bacterium]|nr:hypothetical protein [Tannerellaceae bacterium]